MRNNDPPGGGGPSSDTWPNGDPWLDLATEFRQPERPGRWTVFTGRYPWQIVDGSGTLRFVCDERATVFRGDGGDLFQIDENNFHDAKGQLRNAALGGLLGGLLGSRSTADERRESERRVAAPAQAWLIREEGALTIANVVIAGAGGVDIDLLPSGWLNDRVVAVRATPELAAYIRGLGPVRYRLTAGGRDNGRGELRGPAGHVIAVDQFTCVPVRQAEYTRHDVTQWSYQIFNNPFPASWVFAMLRSTKSISG
ncbi:MAG: hypothetical protein QOF46_2453 [Paraburkholderia sp.]|nr:hypothetical protein [Paraburkholderia sp.]